MPLTEATSKHCKDYAFHPTTPVFRTIEAWIPDIASQFRNDENLGIEWHFIQPVMPAASSKHGFQTLLPISMMAEWRSGECGNAVASWHLALLPDHAHSGLREGETMDSRFPEIPEEGFRNREGFENWLNRLSFSLRLSVAPVIAMRAAMRGCILTEADSDELKSFPQLALQVFRANLTAWVAIKTGVIQLGQAASVAASYVATTPAFSIPAQAASASLSHSATVAVAGRGFFTSEDAVTTATGQAISVVADATNSDEIWHSLTSDVVALVAGLNPRELVQRPLWTGRAPDWWQVVFEKLKNALFEQSANESARAVWQVWIGWLQCRVDGVPSWQLPEEAAGNVEERIALGDGREDFWDRRPEDINAEIMGWLSDPALNDKPERKTRPAIKTSAEKGQPYKNPAPKKKTKSKRDDTTITISISENDLSIPDNESAAKPESELHPATKRADLEPLADTVDGSVDHLGRANIAYALAGRINEVWDQMNKPGTGPPGPAPGFVIHIDAPWGGGKSTFAEHIAQILNPYIVKGPLPAWLKALPIGKDGTWPERFRRPWHIVRFNAWQHQHVTPPWWVFYETIRETVTKQQQWETNRQAEVLPPPASKFAFDDWFDRHPGRPARWLTETAWRFATPTMLINAAILLAVVSVLWLLTFYGFLTFDLEKGAAANAGGDKGGLGLIPTLLVTLFGGGAAVWKLVSAFSASLVPGTPNAANNYSLGSGDPLKRMKKHFVSLLESVHRPVLVIVDDLDRCEPAFVVELVRGMQTILASPRVVYLLLGDRDWIEQSFTEVHKAMKGVEVGPEHRFGGRFVEKAIQFSMVLPDVSEAGRQDYVRQLLTIGGKKVAVEPVTAPPSVLDSSAVPESQKKIVEDLKADAKEVLETDDYQLRELKAKSLADKFDLVQVDLSREAFDQEMAQKLFFRAATDSTAEKATAHMIEGMASILPANPRQIKRIINTLSLLGQVLRIKDPAKRPGSADWQMLARWVVLMVEWPKSWFTLSRHPGIADIALGIAQGKSEDEIAAIETRMKGLGFLPASGTRPLAKLIAANPTVMRALDFLESDWVHKPITGQEIEWLREVMPAASGQVLQPPQQEKPASSDPAAAGKAA